MDRKPWQTWLTPGLYAELFPGGQADLDAFYDDMAERERAGIPSVCRDWETYLAAARIDAAPADEM